jgi:leucyl aminopeptidase
MRSSLPAQLTLLLLACSEQVVASLHDGSEQHVLAPEENINEPDPFSAYGWPDHVAEDTILAALAANPDPVDALLSLRPGLAGHLATSRLIHVLDEANPRWLTEGDKMRLRRDKKKFMDITDHQELYADGVGAWSGKASTCTPCDCGILMVELS